MKSMKISTDAFALLIRVKPGEVDWASKTGSFKGIPMPSKDCHGKYSLNEVMKFKDKLDSLEKKHYLSLGELK